MANPKSFLTQPEADEPAPASEAKPFVARKGGVPIPLDERFILTVERALVQGQPIRSAAWAAGVSAATLQTWLADGAREDCSDPMRRELFQRCCVARANQTAWGIKTLKDIAESGQVGAVQAVVKLLQAQDPDTWGDKSTQRVEVEHSNGPGSAPALAEYTLEEKRMLRQIELAKANRALGAGNAEG